MALLQCELYSETLIRDTQVVVILPQDRAGVEVRGVVYFLHGRGQNPHSWMRYTCLERLCEEYHLAAVMPNADRSFYTDMRYGSQYFTYITQELPEICQRMFRIPDDPAKTYVMGLSMGGYGALKCALTYPERFAGCAAFSAMPDLRFRIGATERGTMKYRELQGIFGMEPAPSESEDLYKLVDKLPEGGPRPRLLMTCGTEDQLFPLNERFSAYLDEKGYAHDYWKWPGIHEWKFWDDSLKKAMPYFFG
ncbi:MAG: prolyl oligopeptidase family serine peptidase [Firmicutes bacterium]|nr:prolyl oligopeptidase family serine peptidase [Bacillota bacterium]